MSDLMVGHLGRGAVALLVIASCQAPPAGAPTVAVRSDASDAWDASVDAQSPDLDAATSPTDAGEDATDSAPNVDPARMCWARHHAYGLVVRVREVGSSTVAVGNVDYGIDWVILDIEAVVAGDMSRVVPAFRKSVYLSSSPGHCVRGTVNCATGADDRRITELTNLKGKRAVITLQLPLRGSQPDDKRMPARWRPVFGGFSAEMPNGCGVMAVDEDWKPPSSWFLPDGGRLQYPD